MILCNTYKPRGLMMRTLVGCSPSTGADWTSTNNDSKITANETLVLMKFMMFGRLDIQPRYENGKAHFTCQVKVALTESVVLLYVSIGLDVEEALPFYFLAKRPGVLFAILLS